MSAPWQDSLDGPRSLGTAPDVAVVALEDPGEILVDGLTRGEDAALSWAARLDLPAPAPGRAAGREGRALVRLDERRLYVLLPRAEAAEAAAHAAGAAVAVDRTGASAMLKVVGPAAPEILARLMAGAGAALRRGEAVETRLADIGIILVREDESVPSYQLLVPRSAGWYCARLLVETARATRRIL